MTSDEMPESLTLDEAYRAAFYLVRDYFRRGARDDGELVLLLQYMWTDPARWDDWQAAVREALSDDGIANPDHRAAGGIDQRGLPKRAVGAVLRRSGHDMSVSEPEDRWAMVAMRFYGPGAILSSLIWFGFAIGAGVTGHPVLAGLFALVGLLVVVAGLRLQRRFWRRMRTKYPGE
jgi:hypothetical protein